MKRLLTIIFLSFLAFSLFSYKINAQELTNQIKINVESIDFSTLEINLNLKDSSKVNYLTGFELTFPSEITGNIAGILKDKSIFVEKIPQENSTLIKIATENLAFDLSADTWLNLKFSVPNLVKPKFGINYLYLPAIKTNFGISNIQYDIVYPETYKKPSFVSAQNINYKNDVEFSADLDKSLFIIWGENPKLNLKLDLTLKNSTNSDNAFLINLPSNHNQQVSYNDFPVVDGGLFDESYNNFAVKNILLKESAQLVLNSNITLGTSKNAPIEVLKYVWKLKEDSTFGQGIINATKELTDSKSKVLEINKYIVASLTPYINEKLSISSLGGIWDKLNGASQYNSFEYCYLTISAAEYLGFKGHLAYGYLILPDFLLSEKRLPHVWCEIDDGENTYFLDPFLEDQFGLNYNLIQPVDRILFGNWHPDMEYNKLLGLISNDSEEIQATISDTFIESESDNNIELTFYPQEGDLYSGDYYYADVNISNKSRSFIQLKDILIDNSSFISTLKIRDFYPALLPQKDTIFTFNNLREQNILFNGSKDLITKVEIDNPNITSNSLSKTQNIFFRINLLNIFKEIILIAVVIVVIVVIYKALLEKRIKRFIKMPNITTK